ncbi:MAG TPA: SprT-like domain-containing protein [Myxococcota bacterium]
MERARPEELIARLNRDGAALAARFGLRYRAIEAEPPRVKRRYGVCYADGTIRIRLSHAATGRPLKYSSLVNTLCHELAHLQHFEHGQRFQRFYRQILEFARAARIYAPAPKPSRLAPPLTASLPIEATAATTQRATTPRLAPPPARSGPLQLTLFEADGR